MVAQQSFDLVTPDELPERLPDAVTLEERLRLVDQSMMSAIAYAVRLDWQSVADGLGRLQQMIRNESEVVRMLEHDERMARRRDLRRLEREARDRERAEAAKIIANAPIGSVTRLTRPLHDKCRTCRAPIIRIMRSADKQLPVNAEPFTDGKKVPRGGTTFLWLVQDNGVGIELSYQGVFDAWHDGKTVHQSHFRTCPQAEQWKIRNRQ